MGLSKLSARCQTCLFADTCKSKKMEAFGFLPLPEQSSKPAETGYRYAENFWDNPKVLIETDWGSGGLVRTSGEIDVNAEELMRMITKMVLRPKQLLKGISYEV